MNAKPRRSSVSWRQLVGAFVCAWAVGCTGSPPTPPPPPAPPSIPARPVGDDAVLLALDCYEPMYQLDANGRVIKLRMQHRLLPDPILAEVAKLKELRNLDFHGVNLTDDGLAHLKDLPKLRTLGIAGTLITDKGLVHLEKLPSLEYVWVPRNTVTPEAIEKLKDAHPDPTLHVYPL